MRKLILFSVLMLFCRVLLAQVSPGSDEMVFSYELVNYNQQQKPDSLSDKPVKANNQTKELNVLKNFRKGLYIAKCLVSNSLRVEVQNASGKKISIKNFFSRGLLRISRFSSGTFIVKANTNGKNLSSGKPLN